MSNSHPSLATARPPLDLAGVNAHRLTRRLRESWAPACGQQAHLNHEALLKTCAARGLTVWREQLGPALRLESVIAFERSLMSIGVRAGLSIPVSVAFGSAFGRVCHALGGGAPAGRSNVAATVGLAMFLFSLIDRLQDDFPDDYAVIGATLAPDTLRRCILGCDLRAFDGLQGSVLALGVLELYRLYLARGLDLLGDDPGGARAQRWYEALLGLQRAQAESLARRPSTTPADAALIARTADPNLTGFWLLAVTACLGLSSEAMEHCRSFAVNYATLTWFMDETADLVVDVQSDLWSGLALRLALDGRDMQSALEAVMCDFGEQGGLLWQQIKRQARGLAWEPDDPFTLTDVLWTYLWGWDGL